MPDFRSLFNEITDYRDEFLYDDVLVPWVAANGNDVNWLCLFALKRGSPIPAASHEDLWHLYAVSRVNDLLLQSHQPDCGFGWIVSAVSIPQYTAFMTALGFYVVKPTMFSSFYHEIVEVEQSNDTDSEIELVHEFWPALMLGPMLFSRAGARVAGGNKHVNKNVAETSTLYWTFCRRNRQTNDLSRGWGSNSQSRTEFRRDYAIKGSAYLNVDAPAVERFVEPREFAEEELKELLRHRCFITSTNPHDDLWPFDLKATMPMNP
jgi:hypothetical protein